MIKKLLALSAVLGVSTAVLAAPLVPRMISHDINFGAREDGLNYGMNGLAPDTLDYIARDLDTEATAIWPVWPFAGPFPVLNAAGVFGGDVAMHVDLFAQDAAPPHLDVSMVGVGRFAIRGAVPAMGVPYTTLIDIVLDQVSLYGYSGQDAYVLEGAGVIVNSFFQELIGHSGVIRGNIDFESNPGFTPKYDPTADPRQGRFAVAYSGEAGQGYATPEPTSMLLLGLGAALLRRRR
ncbi:MAG: hypothetical protein CHACPFDD_01221 [Phycisphaerae bacterium]|nr:hypothetical protein [Phycisphaerae bacterium]